VVTPAGGGLLLSTLLIGLRRRRQR
jgi:LPXTG-motif cell wall-anchored protein